MPKLMHPHLPQVGAPDPELRNSPIFDEPDEEIADETELETGCCYFNNVAYGLGDYVLSGDEVLKCAERGIWVRAGEQRSDEVG